MGSGPVAAESLDLLAKDFDIIAVVTKPKPEHHRGDFPVIELAEKLKIKTYTVANKKELSDLIALKPFQTELAILIDFGIIVSQDVIDYFPKGIVNSHFSLLPEWRGADPISFAILSGQKKTGVSLMLLVEAMDEGDVISCGVQEIDKEETTPQLTKKLIQLSHALLKKSIPEYVEGKSKGIPQSDLADLIPDYPSSPTYSRKLTKDDGILDFNKSAETLEREIRAFIEWPKSKTRLADIDVIVTSSISSNNSGAIGDYSLSDKKIEIFCSKGSLVITSLKPVGKKEMTAESFIAGYRSRLI